MKNKKAAAAFTIQMVISIGIALMVAAALVALVYVNISVPVDSKKDMATTLVNRLIFSQEGIMEFDPLTQRVDITTVNKEKLLDWRNKTVDYRGLLGAKIKVADQAVYINKKTFDRVFHIVNAQFIESVSEGNIQVPKGLYLTEFTVNYHDGKKITKEQLKISIVFKNE